VKIISDFDNEVAVYSEKDKGISEAFNRGISKASSEVIGILNSDDEYYDEFVLERIAKAFQDSSVDFVHGDMLFVDEDLGTNVRKPLMCPLTYAMPYNHPTMFFRRRVYDEIGLFDLNYRYAMDFELVCRMYHSPEACKFKGVYLAGDPIVKMHAGGVSDAMEIRSIDEVERALKEHGLWSSTAFFNLALRRFRIRLKSILKLVRLNILVKIWRKYKWS